jgi:tetratricopeptide (TPR) repeat protein
MSSVSRITSAARRCFSLAFLILSLSAVAKAQEANEDDRAEAQAMLNQGVQAYKNAQFDEAITDFKRAKDLDPSLTNAQLYLAAAYASQYIPGYRSQKNLQYGEQAVQEFRAILEKDPTNLAAIDGIGSILYNMAGTPFDLNKMEESKEYHEKHIQIQPGDPEPHYWVGVIDWSIAYRSNRDLRNEYNRAAKSAVKESDPMPPVLAAQFAQKYGASVDEGIAHLKKAMELRADYDDAMAYLNLLYRQKADMETSRLSRELDLKMADDLVDQVKAIKTKKADQSPYLR